MKINELQGESKSKSGVTEEKPVSDSPEKKREAKLEEKTVNKVSQVTFNQIANSLSPEPEILI